jgi:hypothetical protein
VTRPYLEWCEIDGVKRWRKTAEDICMDLYSEGGTGKKKKIFRIIRDDAFDYADASTELTDI